MRCTRTAAATICLAAAVITVLAPATAFAEGTSPLPTNQQGCLPPPPSSDPDVPWGLQQLDPKAVWPLTQGAGVTVAVVDTGVDAGSPQLAGRVLAGSDVVNPNGASGNTDCYGHGTFVAGIIAAAPENGTGFTGVAPSANILPIRIANTADDVTTASLATGIRRAVDAGARVINVSASTTVSDAGLAAAVAYAEAHDVVLVASAANNAKSGDPVTYPASYPTVVAVGAIDTTGQRAAFSQTGPYLGLVAPGVDVASIGPGGPGQWQGSGTSYAAPFVAGTAALVRSYHPGLTAGEVRRRLESTADHPPAVMPDPQYGWGLVNPLAAVTALVPGEGGTGLGVIAGRSAQAPTPAEIDAIGPALTTLSILGAGAVAFLLRMSWRFFGDGRRRWGPARVLVVTDGLPPGEDHGPPAIQ